MKSRVALLALMGVIGTLHAQCKDGVCIPPRRIFLSPQPQFVPQAPRIVSQQPTFEPIGGLHVVDGHSGARTPVQFQYQWTQIGVGKGYDLAGPLGAKMGHWDGRDYRQYFPANSGRLDDKPSNPPVSPPSDPTLIPPAPQAQKDVQPHADPIAEATQLGTNFGMKADPSPGDPTRETIKMDGKEVSREQAMQAMGQGGIDDDSGMLRMTVIGPEAACKPVMQDVAGGLSDLAKRFLVKDYRADNWAVSRSGFVVAGLPTIYLQSPDGKVLHRQDDYAGGPEKLREAMTSALRDRDPNYKPKSDPNLNAADEIPVALIAGIAAMPVILFLGFGLLAVIHFLRGKS